jgi:hypothetical protein
MFILLIYISLLHSNNYITNKDINILNNEFIIKEISISNTVVHNTPINNKYIFDSFIELFNSNNNKYYKSYFINEYIVENTNSNKVSVVRCVMREQYIKLYYLTSITYEHMATIDEILKDYLDI